MTGSGEANYFRDYKRLGSIAKLATSYMGLRKTNATILRTKSCGLSNSWRSIYSHCLLKPSALPYKTEH